MDPEETIRCSELSVLLAIDAGSKKSTHCLTRGMQQNSCHTCNESVVGILVLFS